MHPRFRRKGGQHTDLIEDLRIVGILAGKCLQLTVTGRKLRQRRTEQTCPAAVPVTALSHHLHRQAAQIVLRLLLLLCFLFSGSKILISSSAFIGFSSYQFTRSPRPFCRSLPALPLSLIIHQSVELLLLQTIGTHRYLTAVVHAVEVAPARDNQIILARIVEQEFCLSASAEGW